MAEGKNKQALQRMSPWQNTVVGFAAGATDVTTTQWMLYCKNATQQRLPLTLDPRMMYRGYSMSLINMCILSGLQFPLTGAVTQVITGGVVRRLTSAEQIGAAFSGGVISGFVCAPMELIMVQQQLTGSSLLATPSAVINATGGPRGLFRGLAMSCGREGVFCAGMLGLGPAIKRYAADAHGASEGTASIAGAIGGGVIVASLSHPMDTIKTCQQGDVAGAKYGGVVATARTLLSETGAARFFSGWSWRTGRMVIQTFLFDFTTTRLSPIFFPELFD